MTPPPGYVSSSTWEQPYRSVRGLATALVVLLAIAAAATAAIAALQVALAGDAEDLLDGVISDAEFEDRLAALGAVSLLVLAVTVAVLVLQILWTYRIASNLLALRRDITFTPGRSIAVWILGGCTLNILNFAMLREHWKATAPVPRASDSWRNEPVTPLLPVWLVLNLLSVGVGFASGLQSFNGVSVGSDNEDLAESLTDSLPLVAASGLLGVLATVTLIAIVRQMTARHERVTGAA